MFTISQFGFEVLLKVTSKLKKKNLEMKILFSIKFHSCSLLYLVF